MAGGHSEGLATARRRPTVSNTGTITLIAMMICLALGGFGYMSGLLTELERTRAEMRDKDVVRHALTKAGHAVAGALVAGDEMPDLSSYNDALTSIVRQPERDIPAIATFKGLATPGRAVLDTLLASWREIIPALHRGDLDGAKLIFMSREAAAKLTSLEGAYSDEVARLERTAAELDRRFDLAVRGVLLAEILAGGFCILAFIVANRRSRREAQERALAISTANASREQVSRLFEMADMLQSATDHQDANAVLRATAADLIPGFGGALYVFSNSRDRLALSTTWNREGRPELPDAIGHQQCWSLKRGKPHVNVPNSHKLSCEHFAGEDCVLEIPMTARGEILGLLQIHAPGEDGEARLAEVQGLGTALADGMSLALANLALRDQLRGQALCDPLTGLYNRRYMEDALQRLAGLAERDKHDLSVIMIDLDHFKRLNDNYGHAKGDAVLRDVSSILLHQIRETDIACRYGGEELIVVLPSCGLENALEKAEHMRVAIEALSEPNGAQVSASMGVASIPSTSIAVKDLLANADAALYESKQAGRNHVASARRRHVPGHAGITLVAAE